MFSKQLRETEIKKRKGGGGEKGDEKTSKRKKKIMCGASNVGICFKF